MTFEQLIQALRETFKRLEAERDSRPADGLTATERAVTLAELRETRAALHETRNEVSRLIQERDSARAALKATEGHLQREASDAARAASQRDEAHGTIRELRKESLELQRLDPDALRARLEGAETERDLLRGRLQEARTAEAALRESLRNTMLENSTLRGSHARMVDDLRTAAKRTVNFGPHSRGWPLLPPHGCEFVQRCKPMTWNPEAFKAVVTHIPMVAGDPRVEDFANAALNILRNRTEYFVCARGSYVRQQLHCVCREGRWDPERMNLDFVPHDGSGRIAAIVRFDRVGAPKD